MPTRVEISDYGPPDVLHPVDYTPPAPGPGDAVVRVTAAAVNRADCFIRSGEWPQVGGWPYVPGLELAGRIEQVGDAVTDFAPGDPVITMMQKLGGIHGIRPGGYQELARVPAETLARVPDTLDLAAAARLGLPAVTALRAIDTLDVSSGARVLITGGTSNVGLAAIQLLAAAGAHVIATTRADAKAADLRAAGAHDVAVTAAADWPGSLDPVDRVFDLVGRATFAAATDLLRPGGRLVFVGGTSGGDLSLSGWTLMRPVTLTGYSTETLTRQELQSAMGTIATATAAGTLAPPATRELPLPDAAEAHRLVEAATFTGRVMLIPPG